MISFCGRNDSDQQRKKSYEIFDKIIIIIKKSQNSRIVNNKKSKKVKILELNNKMSEK